MSVSARLSRFFVRRLVLTYATILVVTLIAAAMWISHLAFDFYQHAQVEELARIARAEEAQVRTQLHSGVPGAAGDELCKSLAQRSGARVTLIDPDGVVIGDSTEKSTNMENHAHRPEVQAALAAKGDATPRAEVRPSYTTGIEFLYVSVPVFESDHIAGVLRLARPMQDIGVVFAPFEAHIWEVAAVIAVLGIVAISFFARRLSRPIDVLADEADALARGDFARRVAFSEPTPLAPLGDALNAMARSLSERLKTVTLERNEREAILASMREGVVALNREDRILIVNRAAEQLLGVKAEEIVGRLVQEALRHAELQRFLHRTRNGADLLAGENPLQWDGERMLSVHSAPLRDDEAREAGLLIVINDVTRLQKLEGLRREFVANVSHELRTPITSIKGFIETLRDGAISEPENALRFLEIIARQADRLNSIIEDLLLLSRIERQDEKEGIDLQEIDARNLLQRVMHNFQPRSTERGVKIELSPEITEVGPVMIRANARLLEQAVTNLVDNALNYTETGKRVTLAAVRNGTEAKIKVTDEGCGIPAQHLSRLFERFYRVDPARSRQMGGTGLGLAIVKHIMQAHTGRATVESQPGHGSTFILHLPI